MQEGKHLAAVGRGQFVALAQHVEHINHGGPGQLFLPGLVFLQDTQQQFQCFFHPVRDNERNGEVIGRLQVGGVRFCGLLQLRQRRQRPGLVQELKPASGLGDAVGIFRQRRQNLARVFDLAVTDQQIAELDMQREILGFIGDQLLQQIS